MKKKIIFLTMITAVATFASYIANTGGGGGGSSTWGSITGTLSSQSDLNTALGLKATSASPTFTGTVTTPVTASRALVTDGSSALAASATTGTELGYVNGVTSAIQTQLNAKQTTTLADGKVLVGNGSNVATAVTPSGDVTVSNAGVTAIGATKVTNAMLAGSIAASKLTGTDIATVGTITSGTWSGTAIGPTKGGTNQTSWTQGDLLYADGTNTLAKLGAGTSGQFLKTNGAGANPAWADATASAPFIGDGSVSAPAFGGGATGTSNTGLYFPSTDKLAVTSDGTKIFDFGAYSFGSNHITTIGGTQQEEQTLKMQSYGWASGYRSAINFTDGTNNWYAGVNPLATNDSGARKAFSLVYGTSTYFIIRDDDLKMYIKRGGVTMTGGDGDQYGNALGGVMNTNITAVGTNADTNEKVLQSYTVQANALDGDSAKIHWTAFGTTAAVTGIIKCVFGSTTLVTTGTVALAGADWMADGIIIRTGGTAQISTARIKVNGVVDINTYSAPGETLANALALKCTGQSTITGNANDIISKGMTMDNYPGN